jgi:hypothetical protein
MKTTSFAVLTAVLTLAITQPAVAQDVKTSIVGTWKITSQVRKEIATGATANIFGPKPVGYITYTKSGHMVWFFVSSDRQAPASANLTDAERAHLFRTLAGGSGTYTVDGKKVTMRYDASWHQLWSGTDVPVDAEINGTTLTMTNLPFKSPQDGKDVTVVTTWERVD